MDIIVKNARQHNLKGIDVKIPRNQLVVFTGVSGSGKSSLVFDTLTAESQRQFFESLSTQSRKYLPKHSRPEVDEISNLSPVVVIDQRRLGRNPRSTVGTVTQIYTYMRLLFSRCGTPIIGDSTLFSFNTAEGACPECKGLGEKLVLDKDRLIDWDKSLNEGAIRYSEYALGGRRWSIVKVSGFFDMDKPLKDFSEEELDKLLYSERIELNDTDEQGFVQSYGFEGLVVGIKRRRIDKRGTSDLSSQQCGRFFSLEFCDICQGSRLSQEANRVKLSGKTISELTNMQLTDLRDFLATVKGPVADPIISKMLESLTSLIEIGVGYLSLNRPVATLSGGESQRVKMAKQLGSDLVELVYVLDEPSVGLHPRDINHLVLQLKKLKKKGNSVLVVEHDVAIIKAADQIIDIGPKAGSLGGKLVFQGSLSELRKNLRSETAKGLKKQVDLLKKAYREPKGYLEVNKAKLHNLKDISVSVPTGVLSCITGVAGSGKSTLVLDVLAKEHPLAIVVDQSPVGRSTKSIPATYIGVFDLIRKKFSQETGEHVGSFSFNSFGGCKKCKGFGYKKVEMHFLDDVIVTCNVCKGKRYKPEMVKHKVNGKNIMQVLEMTALEAYEFFEDEQIKKRLEILKAVGLDYLELGQPLNTLSGGEAQRIKLASQLHKKGNIYILDEPTTGLHMADIEKLMELLNRLVDGGNTVIVIEHNLDVISQVDWIIDLGPEGGEKGGEVMVKGTPMDVLKTKRSYTGQWLKKSFKA